MYFKYLFKKLLYIWKLEIYIYIILKFLFITRLFWFSHMYFNAITSRYIYTYISLCQSITGTESILRRPTTTAGHLCWTRRAKPVADPELTRDRRILGRNEANDQIHRRQNVGILYLHHVKKYTNMIIYI